MTATFAFERYVNGILMAEGVDGRMSDLLPCPFCGGDASLHAYRGSEMVGYVVTATIRCRACGASVSSVDSRDANGWSCKDDAKQKAIAAWNRRTPTAPDIAALIAIEEAKG